MKYIFNNLCTFIYTITWISLQEQQKRNCEDKKTINSQIFNWYCKLESNFRNFRIVKNTEKNHIIHNTRLTILIDMSREFDLFKYIIKSPSNLFFLKKTFLFSLPLLPYFRPGSS